MVVSVTGSSSDAPFAISSALSFPSMPMCLRTHGASILTPLFSSCRFYKFPQYLLAWSWVLFRFASTKDVSSADNTIFDCFLFTYGVSCWNSIAASKASSISASYTSASFPIPSPRLPLSTPLPAPVCFCSFSFIDPSVYVIVLASSYEMGESALPLS